MAKKYIKVMTAFQTQKIGQFWLTTLKMEDLELFRSNAAVPHNHQKVADDSYLQKKLFDF